MAIKKWAFVFCLFLFRFSLFLFFSFSIFLFFYFSIFLLFSFSIFHSKNGADDGNKEMGVCVLSPRNCWLSFDTDQSPHHFFTKMRIMITLVMIMIMLFMIMIKVMIVMIMMIVFFITLRNLSVFMISWVHQSDDEVVFKVLVKYFAEFLELFDIILRDISIDLID